MAVRRQRHVLRPGAEHAGYVEGVRVVDAIADDGTVEGILRGPETDGRHHEERGDVSRPRIDRTVGADLAPAAGADGQAVLDGGPAEEGLVIEELDRASGQPAGGEAEVGAVD